MIEQFQVRDMIVNFCSALVPFAVGCLTCITGWSSHSLCQGYLRHTNDSRE